MHFMIHLAKIQLHTFLPQKTKGIMLCPFFAVHSFMYVISESLDSKGQLKSEWIYEVIDFPK